MHFHHLFQRTGSVIKKNVVMFVAMLAAIITCFIVPPDEAYWDYFDFKTLTCLFCVLAVVCALKNIRFFLCILPMDFLARKCQNSSKNIGLAHFVQDLFYLGS